MLYGLYHSAQGAEVQSARIDVVANNLANAGTVGFKRQLAVFQSNRPYDVENGVDSNAPGNQELLSGGVSTAQVLTEFGTGPLSRTGGALDVALTGSGFLQVSDGSQQYLTRNGRLAMNANGELALQGSGMRVLSNVGTLITIPPEAARIEISNDGSVTSIGSDGERSEIGKLALVQTASTGSLQQIGNSLYQTKASLSPAGADLQVKQGFLEGSGVSQMNEMMEMIQASRAVEANMNLIQYQDDSLDRLLQMAGTH